LTLLTLFFQAKTFFTVILWIIILIVYFIFDSFFFIHLNFKLIIRRKFFHFLACLIYFPGLYFIPKETFKCIVLIVIYIFIIFEIIRNFPYLNNKYIELINNYLKSNIDNRDDNKIILTHIFLLNGISSSIFYNFKNQNYNYLGIIILGIGDSMCSICGVLFGKNKIYYPTNKTLEGTLGGLFTSCFVLSLINGKIISYKELCFMIIIFIYEGFTLEIDNLVLPLFTNYLFLNFY
jgi:dolichol kinase